jgi:hypothetical protein
MCQNLNLRFLPFIAFYQVFFPALFHFFDLAFYCLFSFFIWFFYGPLFSPYFFALVLYLFFAHVVSSLAYPNLLGNKWLGCCCSTHIFTLINIEQACQQSLSVMAKSSG